MDNIAWAIIHIILILVFCYFTGYSFWIVFACNCLLGTLIAISINLQRIADRK
jgi:hypothetical protein